MTYSNFKHGVEFMQQIMGSAFNGLLPEHFYCLILSKGILISENWGAK
jgi:hypothetical protein